MKPHHHDNQQAAADAEHAIDPVCGMTVDPATAAGSERRCAYPLRVARAWRAPCREMSDATGGRHRVPIVRSE